MSYRYSKIKIDGFITDIWYKECECCTTKSSGPGGQNVNKRETKVQLLWNRKSSTRLPSDYHKKFGEIYANLLTDEGILRIDAEVHRTQEANKALLKKKLSQMIHAVFKPPKASRKMTKPPLHVVDKRIAEKKRRSRTRALRKPLV